MRVQASLAINMNTPWLHKSLYRASQLGRVGLVTFVRYVVPLGQATENGVNAQMRGSLVNRLPITESWEVTVTAGT